MPFEISRIYNEMLFNLSNVFYAKSRLSNNNFERIILKSPLKNTKIPLKIFFVLFTGVFVFFEVILYFLGGKTVGAFLNFLGAFLVFLGAFLVFLGGKKVGGIFVFSRGGFNRILSKIP